MSVFTILGIIAGAWALLGVIGAERQHDMKALARRVARELEETGPAAPQPISLPGAATPPKR